MKLSEAILLGSTVLTAKAGGQRFSGGQAGCALGMAAIARGCRFGPVSQPFDERDRRTLGAEAVWGEWLVHTVTRPCRCWRFSIPREMRIKDIIAHIFDYHVMTKKNWTLEQLVAWVETVEPKDFELRPTREDIINDVLARQNADEWWRKLVAQHQEKQDEEEWQAVTRAFAAKRGSTHSPRSRRAKL
ncbi:MAG TPA: hypothetical protein VN948_14335 [Terriglobales bacterium]|nr:hypothetical protein [Terriglobales bacterium]